MTISAPPTGAPSPPESSPPTWVRWRIVTLLLVFSFLNWFNRIAMPTAANMRIMKEFSLSTTQMGVVYSSFLIAYALCMTPGGWLIDRCGPRTMLVVVGFGSALFGVFTGLPGTALVNAALALPALLLIRALMGIFSAPIYPASGRLIAHWIPKPQQALANGLLMGAAVLGIASTPLLFGALIDWLGWPAAFLAAGVLTALVALIWAAFATDYPGQHSGVNQAEERWILGKSSPRAPRADRLAEHDFIFSDPTREEDSAQPARSARLPSARWTALFRNRSLMLLSLSYGAVGYFEYVFFFWMDYYFKEVLHWGDMDSRYASFLLFLGMAASMPLGGWLSDRLQRSYGQRLGRALVPAGGMIGGSVLVVLGVCSTQPAWIVTFFALTMVAIGACEGPCWATAIELGGRHGASAAGIFNTAGNAAGILGPILTPQLGEQLGWGWAIGVCSLVGLAGASAWLGIDPKERVDQASRRS